MSYLKKGKLKTVKSTEIKLWKYDSLHLNLTNINTLERGEIISCCHDNIRRVNALVDISRGDLILPLPQQNAFRWATKSKRTISTNLPLSYVQGEALQRPGAQQDDARAPRWLGDFRRYSVQKKQQVSEEDPRHVDSRFDPTTETLKMRFVTESEKWNQHLKPLVKKKNLTNEGDETVSSPSNPNKRYKFAVKLRTELSASHKNPFSLLSMHLCQKRRTTSPSSQTTIYIYIKRRSTSAAHLQT